MTTTSTTKRVVIDHSKHNHPSTSKARKICREAMAQAAAKKPATKKAAPKKAATIGAA